MQTLYPRSALHLPPSSAPSTYYISRPQLDLIINQLFTTYRAHILQMATTLTSHHTITSHPHPSHYHEQDDITHTITTPMTSTSSPSMTSRPFKSMSASVTSTVTDTHSPSFTRIYPPMFIPSHHHTTGCQSEDHFESLPPSVKSSTSSSSTSTSIYSSASTQSTSTASSSSSSSTSTTSSPLHSSRSPSFKSSKSLNHLSSHRSSLSNVDLFAHDSREYGIVLADRDQSITHVNSGFTAITGYTCWESVGRNCNFLQGEKTNYEAVRVMRDSLQHNQTCRVGILNYKKNGEPFWNMLTITPLFDAHGQIHHYVGIQVVTSNMTYVDRPTPLFPWNQTPDAPSASYKQQRLIKSGNGPRRNSIDEGEQEMASYKQRQRGEITSTATTSTSSTTTTPKQPKLKSTPISFVAETNLPTDKGMFRVRAYKDLSKGNSVDSEIMCIIKGDIENSSDVIIRVHDQCYTSEILGSLKCDCRQQLDHAMLYIQQHNGMIIYMPQEGRGIGLANKIKAYSVQELGYDTVDANRVLGFEDDLREYNVVPSILAELGISSVRLITNNPRKIDQLTDLGIQVNGRVPIIMETNIHSHGYIAAKRARMGHHQS